MITDMNYKDSAEEVVIAALASANPEADTRKGTAIRELVVAPQASIYANMQDYIAEHTKGLAELLAETVPNYERIEALLSNINMTRLPGIKASGLLLGYVAYSTDISFAEGYKIKAGDLVYEVTEAVTLTPTARLDGDGYFILIPVTAEAVGVEYNIAAGTAMEEQGLTVGGPITAHIMTGGAGAESATAIAARLEEGIPTGVVSLASRKGLASLAKIYPALRDVNAVGLGDAEMIRDTTNPFGTSGMCVDVYVKTYDEPVIHTLAIEAVLGQIRLTNPGDLLTIKQIYEEPSDVYGTLLEPVHTLLQTTSANPHLTAVDDDMYLSTYAEYQITLNKSITGTVYVDVYTCPYLADLQATVDSPEHKSFNADVVVKAAVPVYLGMELSIIADSTINEDMIESAVVNYVNTRNIGQPLYLTELVDALKVLYPQIKNVSNIDISAQYTDAGQVVRTLKVVDNQLTHNTSGPVTDKNAIFKITKEYIHVTATYI